MSKQDKLRKEIELVNSKIDRLYWWRGQLESKLSAVSLKQGVCSATLLYPEVNQDRGRSDLACDEKPASRSKQTKGRRDFYDL